MTDPETLLIARANNELAELRSQFKTINFVMTPETAMLIVGALQLACRHEDFKNTTAHAVTLEFIQEVAVQLEGCPALLELIKLGDQPTHYFYKESDR